MSAPFTSDLLLGMKRIIGQAWKDWFSSVDTTIAGLGTMSTQNANNVAITGGSVAGITDLAVADGGTGASTAADARTNIGCGTAATKNTGTSGNTVPLLDGANAWSSLQTFSSGIKLGTGTTLANYEEGTFTPVIIGTVSAGTGTYTRQIGRYTRIGDRIIYSLIVTWTAHTGTGNIQVGGMPFASVNSTDAYSTAAIHVSNIALTASNLCQCYIAPNASVINITQYPTGGGAAAGVPMDAAGEFLVSGFYEV